MAFTINLATTIGRARLLIPDRVPESAKFSDEELGAFLAVEGGDDARLAAAAALESLAADVLLTVGDYRVEDLQTNASKTATTMLARAAALREQSRLEEDKDGGAFDWAEQVTDVFTARERLIDQAYRGVV